ncbi:glycogen/starch synthase, partial [Undibacterium sp.]
MRPRVLLVSSEAVPLVKTGGLADVITALALSLEEQGVDA